MHIRFLFIMLLVCAGIQAQAQHVLGKENLTVYGRDGSIFHASLVEANAKELVLKITTGDTIRVKRTFIKKLMSSETLFLYRKARYHHKTGLYGFTNVSLGGSDSEVTSIITTTFGYRLTERASVGIGGGIGYTDALLGNGWAFNQFAPVYGYGRYNVTNKRRRLYVDAKLGYGIAYNNGVNDDHSGGVFFNPGMGFHCATRWKMNWHIGIGQVIYNTTGVNFELDRNQLPVTTNYSIWYNRTTFQFGVEFHLGLD